VAGGVPVDGRGARLACFAQMAVDGDMGAHRAPSRVCGVSVSPPWAHHAPTVAKRCRFLIDRAIIWLRIKDISFASAPVTLLAPLAKAIGEQKCKTKKEVVDRPVFASWGSHDDHCGPLQAPQARAKMAPPVGNRAGHHGRA
jgi:hypothetical protein